MKAIIDIFENRVAVSMEYGKTAQFVVWDLEPEQKKNLELQFQTAFAICSNFEQIERHLKLNGFDAHLEDIY